jgi:hypothetical protein
MHAAPTPPPPVPAPAVVRRQSTVPAVERLGGRWSCTITADEPRPRTIATGVFDVLHAGSCLVGSGWTDGVPLARPRLVDDVQPATPVFEGSLFGAARGDEIVYWITNRLGTALWVLRGRPAASRDVVVGAATYTDEAHASQPPYEASFVLRRS